MRKILVIENCADCPFFDYEYPYFEGKCEETDLYTEKVAPDYFRIPSTCPLEDETNDQRQSVSWVKALYRSSRAG
jgi:hypothetical protein